MDEEKFKEFLSRLPQPTVVVHVTEKKKISMIQFTAMIAAANVPENSNPNYYGCRVRSGWQEFATEWKGIDAERKKFFENFSNSDLNSLELASKRFEREVVNARINNIDDSVEITFTEIPKGWVILVRGSSYKHPGQPIKKGFKLLRHDGTLRCYIAPPFNKK